MPVTSDIPQNPAAMASSRAEQLQQQFNDDPVLKVIHQNLPEGFVEASAEDLEAYRLALRASKFARTELKKVLKPLRGLADFAEPLLQEALDKRFGPGFDPVTDTLFYPTLRPNGATGTATRLTLLEAALHNFERKESVYGGFLPSAAIQSARNERHFKNVRPELFADVCRQLNLGRRYQDHLEEVLEPQFSVTVAPRVARSNIRGTFLWNDRADMTLYAHAAFLRKKISRGALDAILAITRRQPDPQFNGLPILLQSVSLLGVEIPRVVLIKPLTTWTFTSTPLVLYVAQDPIDPFKEFSSLDEVEDELRARLTGAAYQTFFAQLVGERKRAEFFTALNKHLVKLVPMDGNPFTRGLWHHVPDPRADLRIELNPFDGQLFHRMHQQQITLIKDNARFLAVPTEDEDEKSRSQRLQAWFGLGMNIASVASFFVPVLGQLMMAYAAVELVGEVYQGLDDLSHGDLEEGFGHLVGVATNIAFMVAIGKAASATALPEPPPIQSNNFVGKVVPIKLRDGRTKLWKPDLEPFQAKIEIPVGASPDLNGIVQIKDRKYLTIEARTYEVEHNKALGKWQIKHPVPDYPFLPTLEHDGAGAFRHLAEQPQLWAKDRLFRRLGHSVSGLSERSAEQILAVAGVDEAVLRQVHLQSATPPGHLRDTIKRFQLDSALDASEQSGHTRQQEFERLYAASENSSVSAVQALRRDFPMLTVSVADDLVATSYESEIQQMIETGRVPLRLGEAASWHVRQTRLNRALEGFYLNSVAMNPDTETLSLGLLEKLPGWSDQVCLEVRQDSPRGSLLARVGNPEAADIKMLVRSNSQYQAFDAQGNELNGTSRDGNNLFSSILHALPDQARSSIGFARVGQSAELQAALGRLATTDREQAALILGQRREILRFNAPKRLKDGRLGYGLSGRGRLPGDVLEEQLLDKLGLLELRNTLPRQVLAMLSGSGMSRVDINARLDVLLGEHQALRDSLDVWAQASAGALTPGQSTMASRARIGEAILDHWQAANLTGSAETALLRLESVVLADFPAQLPDFFYARVENLQLSNVVAHRGTSLRWHLEPSSGSGVLEEFLRRFPQTTALGITRAPSAGMNFAEFFDLPRIVAARLPGLRSLSLINQGMVITAETLNTLGAMPHLQALDLSGNRFAALYLPSGSVTLNLRRLGLDNTGMENWPHWLSELLPEHINELSLVDNQISVLPGAILQGEPSAHTTLIRLRGNRLSRSDIIEASLRAAGTGRTTRIDVGVTQLQPHLDTLLAQQSELEAAIVDWAEASTSTVSLSQEALDIRRRLGNSLIDYWRSAVSGRVTLPVHIDSLALSQFPQRLPETFYQNVSSLMLTDVVADADELNRFLRSFSQLRSLQMDGYVVAMTRPPLALRELSRLRELSLTNQGMLIDQQTIEFLSGLGGLRHLNLSGNRLGSIAYTPAMNRHWESVILDNVGLHSWPEWLDPYLPGGIDALSLAHNQLTELPEEILRNRRNEHAHTEISLDGNPLSQATMRSAHLSEYGHVRSFTFYMDLPPEIRNLPPERAWSSSESENGSLAIDDSPVGSPLHRHGATGADATATANVGDWLAGTPDEIAGQQALWDEVQAQGDAPMLMSLVGRLRETADYLRTRTALTPRVWYVLGAAARDPQLRMLLNAMAEEAIIRRTCGDGVRLEFNQMEIQVLLRDSLRDVQGGDRGAQLYRLMQRFYRLDEVDALALANRGVRDEAEVRLAYRLRLAERLNLPLPPSNMLYRAAAAVTAEELQGVEGTVRSRQGGPEFLDNAIHRDFWVAWLRESYASEFADIKATFEAERLSLEDEFPEIDQAYLVRIGELDAQQKARELELLKQLTYREGMKYAE